MSLSQHVYELIILRICVTRCKVRQLRVKDAFTICVSSLNNHQHYVEIIEPCRLCFVSRDRRRERQERLRVNNEISLLCFFYRSQQHLHVFLLSLHLW